MANLFVLDLTYVTGPDAADEHMAAHREWLSQKYTDGVFIASGRKEPRTGGVILAAGERSVVEAAVATDPFTTEGVATYTITEFVPTMTAPALAEYRVAP